MKHQRNIIKDLKYSLLGMMVVFLLSLLGFAGFNFAQGQYYNYQQNQDQRYYQTVSSDELLNVKSVLAPEKLEQGKDLLVEFCREPIARIVAVNNIRTFYIDEDGKEVAVKQRQLPDGIEYETTEDNCPIIAIQAINQPQQLGLYRFCQRFEFPVRGNEKIATFCTTEYELIPPK